VRDRQSVSQSFVGLPPLNKTVPVHAGLDRFAPPLAPWTRCPACNGPLSAIAKAAVAPVLRPGTRRNLPGVLPLPRASTHARTSSASGVLGAQIIQLGHARLEYGRRPSAMQNGGIT
jgi:hypothetical protein